MSLVSLKCPQDVAERMTELISPVYLLTVLGCIVAINLGAIGDVVTSEMRQQQVFIYFMLYFYAIAFMGVTYLPHLIIRIILVTTFSLGIIAYRN